MKLTEKDAQGKIMSEVEAAGKVSMRLVGPTTRHVTVTLGAGESASIVTRQDSTPAPMANGSRFTPIPLGADGEFFGVLTNTMADTMQFSMSGRIEGTTVTVTDTSGVKVAAGTLIEGTSVDLASNQSVYVRVHFATPPTEADGFGVNAYNPMS